MALKPITHPLRVSRKISETADTVSFVLDIPAGLKTTFLYKPGQFVTLVLTIDGQEIRRSYSLCTSPLVDSDFKITVKRVPGGLGSNFLLDRVREGDTLLVTPPAGIFFKPPVDLEPRHYLLFAGGSGITPIFSILKSVLTSDEHKVTLVYANRKQDGIIFKTELEGWAKDYPERLRVVHILSQPDDGWLGPSGRCTEPLLNGILDAAVGPKDRGEYYVCGPDGFMNLVEMALKARGVSKEHIRRESFNTTPEAPEAATTAVGGSDKVLIGSKPAHARPQKLIVKLDGDEIEVEAADGVSVLETLLNAGYNPPYSCMDGACMACMAKVQEGQVYQEDPGILTDDNLADGECLTCQARPVAAVVRVSYDDI